MLRLLAPSVLLCASLALPVHADTFQSYVTGEVGAADQIFRITFDPEVEAATIELFIAETVRVDGIDFLAGGKQLVTGAQGGVGGGAIKRYSIALATGLLPDLVPNTDIGAPGGVSQPSSVLSTATHVYYVENQFGFAGPAGHRIMRTPIAGPSGATEVVFDGALPMAGGLTNYEGLLIEDSNLYFFAADPGAPGVRFLFRIGLAGGTWDGVPPVPLVGPTPAAPAGDGADELTIDPFNRVIFGSNIINGEIVFYDIPGAGGGLFVPPGPYPPGSKRERLTTMAPDGIRFTGTGWLVLTGLAGVIASVDVGGVIADGLDEGDIRIQYDDAVSANGYAFDDLTPLLAVTPTPALPGTAALWLALGCLGVLTGALERIGKRAGVRS